MSNIVKSTEVSIAKSGEGYISQRAVNRLFNLEKDRVGSDLRNGRFGGGLKTNDTNQLSEKLLVKAGGYYAMKGNPLAIEFLEKIALAGARVFIYGLAGRQEIKRLQNKTPKLIGVSSQVNRKLIHEQRETLFIEGVCDKWTETVTHYYYPVNDRGLAAGYENIGRNN